MRSINFLLTYLHEKCIVVTRVCVSVCVSVRGRMPTLLHGPECNLGSGSGCPLVVHYWADLQSLHGMRCYGPMATLWKCVAEPSGNPPGPAHAARTTHARTHQR